MELPHIGKQCAYAGCKQLDFLPFECAHCKLIFCNCHYLPEEHNCSEQHIHRETAAVSIISYNCSLCGSKSPVEMNCPVCLKHFCLQHRHHGCLDGDDKVKKMDANICKKEYELAKRKVDLEVDRKLSLAKKKNSKTAVKVQLMKLKNKAIGNKAVPTAERIYFMVFTPASLSKQSTAVFVSRQWTVGRAIDSISDLCGVQNNNNDLAAPKLRLFHHQDGHLICSQTDKKLHDLIEENLVLDGESLILEYVNDLSCVQLENVCEYKF